MLSGVTRAQPARVRADPLDRRLGGAHGRRRRRRAHSPPTCPPGRPSGSSSATSRSWPTAVVRYEGEPVALVAAETLEQAREAAAAIAVDYEPLPAVTDMEAALAPDAPQVHEFGNVLRHVHIVHGDPDGVEPDVWVEGYYETAMQDQAALGPEGGLAVPAGGRRRRPLRRTQWLHVDRQQIAPCLGLPEEQVRLTLAGVGGAFGSREDVHVQIHACLLALAHAAGR